MTSLSGESTPRQRPLTRRQFDRLAPLAGGAMVVSGGTKRAWETLYKRGLIVGELGAQGCYINGITITPDGLRAFADGLERHGWRCIRCFGTGAHASDETECPRCKSAGRTDWNLV